METKVVFVSNDGQYVFNILKDVTDIQDLNGTLVFYNGSKLLFGVSNSKLVYFEMNHA